MQLTPREGTVAALTTIPCMRSRSFRKRDFRTIRCGAPAFAGFFMVGPVPGAHAATEFFLAADATSFHYEEFLEGETSVFNREEGGLPGARLSLEISDTRLFTRLDASFHVGEVDYWSPANGGSTSGAVFSSIAGEVGGWFSTERRWAGFVRFARRVWGRDLHGTAEASGYFEEYRWSEVGVGVRHRWGTPDHGWRHEGAVMAYAVTGGSLYVQLSDVSPLLRDQTLDLGDNSGMRLRYTAIREFGSDWAFRVEPYYEYWEFGRSNKEAVLTTYDIPVGTVREPRSESQRIGVAVGVVF